jgi:hypothetical protein
MAQGLELRTVRVVSVVVAVAITSAMTLPLLALAARVIG